MALRYVGTVRDLRCDRCDVEIRDGSATRIGISEPVGMERYRYFCAGCWAHIAAVMGIMEEKP
jgi:hypothetical protein